MAHALGIETRGLLFLQDLRKAHDRAQRRAQVVRNAVCQAIELGLQRFDPAIRGLKRSRHI